MADRAVRCLKFKPKQGTRAFPSDDPAWPRLQISTSLQVFFEARTEQTTNRTIRTMTSVKKIHRVVVSH